MTLDSEEVEKIARQGLRLRFAPFEWVRGPARYDRERDEIVITRSRTEQYIPAEEPSLLFDLADVSSPDDAVVFAQRFGLFTKGPDDKELRERFRDMREEAEMLWLYLRLYEVIRRALRGVADARRELASIWYQRLEESARALEGFGVTTRPPDDDDELVEWCIAFLAWMTNEGMRGCELVVFGESDGWSVAGWPNSLLGHAYQELAFLIGERRPVLVCEECGRVFPVSHGRQRFCDPACSNRSRNRRWRKGEEP